MGRIADHSFAVLFVLTGAKYSEINPTFQELKVVAEKLGIKVSLPTSRGDPAIFEYEEISQPIVPPAPIQAPVPAPAPAIPSARKKQEKKPITRKHK